MTTPGGRYRDVCRAAAEELAERLDVLEADLTCRAQTSAPIRPNAKT